MRARLLALSVGLCLLAGCGDDGKVVPDAKPGAPVRKNRKELVDPEEAATQTPLDRAALASWAQTRPGDTATWEIRVKGSPAVTRLTWKAVEIQDGILRFEVDSTTVDGAGRTLATASSPDERHAVGVDPRLPQGVQKPFELGEVGGKRIRQIRQAGPRVDGIIITVSDQVPFGGLVRRRMSDVDQVLVAFEKAP